MEYEELGFKLSKKDALELSECIDVDKYIANLALKDVLTKRIHVGQAYSKKSGIYIIYNTANSKKYIGSAKTFISRITSHCKLLNDKNHFSKKLQNDINSLGIETFFIKLFPYTIDRDLLFDLESFLILKYNTINNGYNTLVDSRYKAISEDYKKVIGERLSKANKGIPKSLEHRQKCGISISLTNRADGNPFSKLTKDDVIWIRSNFKSFSIIELCNKFNVSKNVIRSILHLRSWNYTDCIPENYIVPTRIKRNDQLSDSDILFIRNNLSKYYISDFCKKYNCTRKVISGIIYLSTYNYPNLIPYNYNPNVLLSEHYCKIPDKEVLIIRQTYKEYTLSQLAAKYKVKEQSIINLLNLKSWRKERYIPKDYVKPDKQWFSNDRL